jgi:histidine decarboxylase
MDQTPESRKRLNALYDSLRDDRDNCVGYPVNAVFDYSPLFRFLSYPLNNVGDPFVPSNYRLNTHAIECEVLQAFAEMTHAPAKGWWGYVTNGGTEGNMYGIFLARELHPEGVVYYSENTHYSVSKILRCLHMRNIMIRSESDGRVCLDDLRETLRIHRDVPPIIFANIGTTMQGAVDDLDGIRQILKDLAIHNAYIHADAALSGMILPFVECPQAWDFRAGVDSIAISGHKMIGSPIPCGVVLARKSHVDRIARHVEYVGTLDTTISGSRNGFTPLILWYALRSAGRAGLRDMIRGCLQNADYAVEVLRQVGKHPLRHSNSVTVVFERPSRRLIEKWQIAVHHEKAHVITMPQVTRERLERLAADLADDQPGSDRDSEEL